jgi:hypothetical protein
MRIVIAINAITDGSLQYVAFSDGVLMPIKAKRIFEKPTTSAEVQNHEAEPIRNAQTSGAMRYV